MALGELDPGREVYPCAPLQLVACEVVYAPAPGASFGTASDALYERLSHAYPLPGPPPSMTLEVGPAGAVTHKQQSFRFLDFQQTRSVAVSPASIVVETSQYNRFEEFLERVTEAVAALGSVVRVAAASRIGLRYIDEVSMSDLPSRSFDGYFTEAILAPGRPVPDVGEPVEFLTTSRFAVGPDRNTVMRTGVLTTPVVAPEGPLTIARPTTPPFFLIDIDSAWQAGPATRQLPFDASAIEDVLYSLHTPVRALFEQSITEKLRNDVLRKEETAA